MRSAQPGERVWVLGRPEQGSAQFAADLFSTPDAGDCVYHVGESDPATDWPAFHPGPLSAATGHRSLTAELRFDRPAASPSGHVLVLELFASTGPCPELAVDVNGQSGVFFLDPVRESRADITEPSPIAGWVRLEIRVADGWLVDGENSIRLTTLAVDAPGEDELAVGTHAFFGSLFGSGFRYGHVGLYRAAAECPTEPSVRLVPLPLFVEEDGELRELVDLLITAPQGLGDASVVLRLAADHREIKVDVPGFDLGEWRGRISVPALIETCEVVIDLELEGAVHQHRTQLRPARRWTVHVIPHVHLDVGYTDLQGKVIELHSRNVERAVEILATNPDYAFSLDGGFILRKFLGSRSPAAVTAARAALQSGRISVQAFHTLFLTGLASLEECYRSAYYSIDTLEELGVPLTYANLTDVPSYSWAVPSILADLGVSAFMGIQNHTRASNEDADVQHLVSPVRWQGPDGQQVLAFFADCYGTMRRLFADPPTIAGGTDGVCRLLARYERDDYVPTDLPIVGSHADNEDLGSLEADVVTRWNERYVFPRLRYSTIADYFAAVRPLTEQLPVYLGDGGSYWEDGVGSAAATMSTYRRAQTLLPAAEALLALLAAGSPSLVPPRAELDRAWQAMEFGCEHTWTAYHAVAHPDSDESARQTAWKVNQVESAAQLARELTDRAMSQLAEQVPLSGAAVIVFNPSSWPRTDVVEVELPAHAVLMGPDGLPVDDLVAHDNNGLQLRRFVAADVPPLGYRVFPLAGAGAPSLVLGDPEAGATTPADGGPMTSLQTDRYLVEVSGGRVTGLLHRPTGHQLVDQLSPYSLAEVLYVRGGGTETGRGVGSDRSSLFDYDRTLDEPVLDVEPAALVVHEVRRTPWGLDVELRGDGMSLSSVAVTMSLHDDDDEVEIVVRLDKQAVLAKESVYVAFPFAVDSPVLRYDRQQGWVDPAVDSQPGACVEWFAAQHTVGLEGDPTVAWSSVDAPLFTHGDIVRGRWPRTFCPDNGWLFSWVMNNYWWTNFPASQEGPHVFRYRFRPFASWQPVAAARFGRATRTPLIAGHARPLDKRHWGAGSLPPDGGSLADLELSENLVVSVVAGRAGDVIVRVQDVAGATGTAMLPAGFLAGRVVHRCNAAERRQSRIPVGPDGAVGIHVGPHSVVTVSISEEIGESHD